ncbi:hypothetical protein Tco_1289613 [Tanacetum coccineum]
MKWLPKLMEYNYEVVYKKGLDNGAADALSRHGNGSELLGVLTKWTSCKEELFLGNKTLLRKGMIVVGQDADLRREFYNTSMRAQLEVRIYKKSQENSQKRASTGTRIRREQKEAKEPKPKPEKLNPQSNPVKVVKLRQRSTKDVGFALDPLTELAQHVTSKNDMLAILRCPQYDPTAIKLVQKFDMIGWQRL